MFYSTIHLHIVHVHVFLGTCIESHPHDTEIEELLERKNAKIQRQVQRPPLDVSDIFLRLPEGNMIFENEYIFISPY
jgi:hypothetical protein